MATSPLGTSSNPQSSSVATGAGSLQVSPFAPTASEVAAGLAKYGVLGGGSGPSPSPTPSTNPTSQPTTAALPNQPTQPQQYVVSSGDTLSSIATKYGSNIQAIMQANSSIENPNQVAAGSRLTIPGSNPPQGQTSLSQVANQIYGAVSKVPDQTDSAAVVAAGTAASTAATEQDPLTAATAPIISQLQSAITQIMSPSSTNSSLQDEYNNLIQSSGLQAVNTQLLNLQNVMNGTTDDVRSELTQANGFATESQVQAMSTARNNVLLKQYNALATQQASLQDTVNNQMQFAESDRTDALSRINDVTGIESTMAGLQQTMFTNAQKQYDNVVTQVGYQGLAQVVGSDPYQQALAESALGLPQGTLSDPDKVAALQTFKQQQLAQGAQRLVIQEYNAGLPGAGGTVGATDPSTQAAPIVASISTGSDSQGRQLNLSSAQAAKLVASSPKDVTVDPGTSNLVVDGVGYYVAQSDGSYKLSLDPSSTEGQYYNFKQQIAAANATPATGSALNKRRESMTTQAAIKQYVANPVYQQVSNGAAYLSRIQAAQQSPGSVSDADLLDAIVKIDTGGGQITEQQVNTITGGATWADKFAVVNGKVEGNGGVLSPNQRSQLSQLANNVYDELNGKYQGLYVQAMQNLSSQGIPANYWGNMPDFSELINDGSTPQ